MAKNKKAAKKQESAAQAVEAAKEPGKSVLMAAFDAFQRGDMVTTRRLANEVLAGKMGKDDERAAAELAKLFSVEGAPVKEAVEDVARELVLRTKVPPKPYAFAALSLGIFVLLVVLAATRYAAF